MRSMSGVSRVLFVATVCVSCNSTTRLLPDLPCFDAAKLKAEPVIYGVLSQDPSVPGGWSGTEVHFGVDAGGRLTAAVRETGGAARTRPVQRVTYDAKRDSISFTYVAPGNTKFTRTFRPRCDVLVGSATYFRAADDTSGIAVSDTLPRVERK